MVLTFVLFGVWNVALLGAVGWLAVNRPQPHAPATCSHVAFDDTALRNEVAACHIEIDRLTIGVSEGIQAIERHRKRVSGVVTRARKELADHGLESPQLEVEFGDLRAVDGGGGEVAAMPPMRNEMGPVAASSIPGVSPQQLAQARGMI